MSLRRGRPTSPGARGGHRRLAWWGHERALVRALDTLGATAADVRWVFLTHSLGADTRHAFLVPGRTAGSVVYLFGGVLFLGDAVTWSRSGGFAPATRGCPADATAAASHLADLWPRLLVGRVREACTAHAHRAPCTPTFLADVAR